MGNTKTKKWTIEDANELYRIEEWGNGYFHIDDDGEVHVRLKGKSNESSISLKQIAISVEPAFSCSVEGLDATHRRTFALPPWHRRG